MYRVVIRGSYQGTHGDLVEAIRQVEREARPYGHPWQIDVSGTVVASGSGR